MIKNIAQQEKIRDLSSRLVYGIYVKDKYNYKVIYDLDYHPNLYDCIPYLRPLTSMTEEEEAELLNICGGVFLYKGEISIPIDHPTCESVELPIHTIVMATNWLYSHHFDINGLIEKGLALEAPVDMYT